MSIGTLFMSNYHCPKGARAKHCKMPCFYRTCTKTWTLDSGRWTIDGRWTVDDGQRTADDECRLCFRHAMWSRKICEKQRFAKKTEICEMYVPVTQCINILSVDCVTQKRIFRQRFCSILRRSLEYFPNSGW